MNTIFGSTMATCKFAKDSSAPLGAEDGGTVGGGTEDCEIEELRTIFSEHAIPNEDNNGATSSTSKTSKIGKTNNKKKTNKRSRTDFDPLVAAINRESSKIAKVIKEVGKSDLFNTLWLSMVVSKRLNYPSIILIWSPNLT
jgi:hypothetical protein